jgi:hypothetical protein
LKPETLAEPYRVNTRFLFAGFLPRLLQVPALYVDALWLHYDNSERDLFIPTRSPGDRARERSTGDHTIAP